MSKARSPREVCSTTIGTRGSCALPFRLSVRNPAGDPEKPRPPHRMARQCGHSSNGPSPPRRRCAPPSTPRPKGAPRGFLPLSSRSSPDSRRRPSPGPTSSFPQEPGVQSSVGRSSRSSRRPEPVASASARSAATGFADSTRRSTALRMAMSSRRESARPSALARSSERASLRSLGGFEPGPVAASRSDWRSSSSETSMPSAATIAASTLSRRRACSASGSSRG